MYIIDTDVLIWGLRGEEKAIKKLSKLKEDTYLSISAISIGEIYKNAYPSEFVETEEFINQFTVYDINRKIAKQAGLYWQQFSKKLAKLSLGDCIVAVTAKEYNLTLVTINTRHFPMRDIKVISP